MKLSSAPALFAVAIGLLGISLSACEGDEPPPDPPATECDADRPCPDDDVCDDDGACVAGCPVGSLSCPCDDDGACGSAGLVCGADDTCQDPACEQGSIDCGCTAALTCGAGPDGGVLRCDADFRVCRLVVDDSELPGVPLASCFTPCTESLALPDGSFRECRPDRLMAGCIAGLECVQGTCVGNGSNPSTCARPTDCPEFQTCMDGGCYSNCDSTDQCGAGGVCHLHVCRFECDTTSPCATGFTCETFDGDSGVCLPVSPAAAQPSTPVDEAFVVSVDDDSGNPAPASATDHESMTFNARFQKRTFRITNHAARSLPFTVTKLEEVHVGDDGREIITINPLFWLSMGERGDAQQQQAFTVTLQPGETKAFEVADPDNESLRYWEGRLKIGAPGLSSRELWLEYASDPDGQWSGTVHYFNNFDDDQINLWLNNKTATNAALTKNALLVQWTNFRSNPLFTLRQFSTLLKATREELWSQQATQNACDETFPNTITEQHCYLYADGAPGGQGVVVYTDDAAEKRIPTGKLEMPFAMNIAADPGNPGAFVGRIESARALQFPGNPELHLAFGSAADECESDGDACIAAISEFSATVVLGGRHLLEPGQSCATSSLVRTQTPWLLSDFLQGTAINASDGRRYRQECKESTFPFDAATTSLAARLNASLTDSNPIPDGRVRRRDLTLLDGVMVNQDTMILLVREAFDANLGNGTSNANFSTYGVIQLKKNDIEPSAADVVPGLLPATPTQPAVDLLATQCVPGLVNAAIGTTSITANNAGALVRTLIQGVDPSAATQLSSTEVNNQIHYLCHTTGRFDGGPSSYGSSGAEPCPATSQVTFFRFPGAVAAVKDDACQGASSDRCPDGDCTISGRPGSCAEKLQALSATALNINSRATLNPPAICESATVAGTPDFETVNCSRDRTNLRIGKLFFNAGSAAPFTTLRAAVDDAFRFKSRFRARAGQGIGFVPSVCALDSDVLPYCYDPVAIEALRERVDCITSVFNTFPAVNSPPAGGMSTATRSLVKNTLQEAFSFYGEGAPGAAIAAGAIPFDGFERLYSELLIMKGDDALTKASSSRFDLAGAQNALFEGDLLEADGIRISGGAGFEMNLLYQSTQDYQLVLDRFARLSPTLWKGLDNTVNNVITLDSISTYFSRVILASTNKARAVSDIAARYRSFDRPDLARRVIERAYAQAYLEQAAVSQFMRRSVAVLDNNEVDALQIELQRANRQYAIALGQMLDDYRGITDNETFFGDPPEFISFPQAGSFDVSAVQTMIDRANDTVRVAKEKEERALQVSRTFDTDAAQFQSELNRVSTGFENELGDICGLFRGANGRQNPAIPKFASQSTLAGVLGNPCGLVGNGAIFDALGDLDQAAIDMRIAVQAVRDTVAEAEIEKQRARSECGATFQLGALKFQQAGRVITVQDQINGLNVQIGAWEKKLASMDRASKLTSSIAGAAAQVQSAADSCSPAKMLTGNAIACGAGVVASAASIALVGVDIAVLTLQDNANDDITAKQNSINSKEIEIAQLQAAGDFQQQVGQCCLDPNPTVGSCRNPGPLMINSNARVSTIMIGMKRAELGVDRAELEVQLIRGRLAQLHAKAQRLIANQADSEQLLINVEAARNDPNVRILKNADVLDADKSFKNAQVDAFRATRVFEYYTGQSYADKAVLFEARLVGRGENSIENYVNDLLRDLRSFEDSFGRPSPRLAIVSLKNDVFKVPRLSAEGVALNDNQRDTEFRRRLADVSLLDARGYIAVPFSTELTDTSPLTAVHKMTGVEIDLQGTGLGDSLAHLYLTARGTGTVRNTDGELIFHRFPAITAVVNPTFGGQKRDDPSLYRNTRLQDRPFVNTTWELGLNQRDETVNADINLSGLQDIKVYFYYEDFTFIQ